MNEPLHVIVNHPTLAGKWCVSILVGECETMDEATKLAKDLAPQIGQVFGLRKKTNAT